MSLPHSSVSPRITGSLPSSAVTKGNQLQIHPVDELINTTFICSVTNALGTGRAELPILLRGEEPPGWGEQRNQRRWPQQDSL